MSDLVTKVARIIDPAHWRMIDDYLARPEGSALHTAGVNYRDMALTKARAAIKAVAEWGRNNFYDDKPLEEFLGELLAQLKEGSE